MTRPTNVIVVSVFALLFATVAAWLTFGFLRRELSSVQSAQPQRLVVAGSEIPIGATIVPSQLKETSWPRESIPAGSAQQAAALVGRVAIRPIAKGDAVTEQKLKPRSGTAGAGFMTYVVPPGHRAVTVAVNEVAGVAGFLTPNDRVDVVVTTSLPAGENQPVSKIVLENVPILATGQVTDQKEGKPAVVPTVTLDLAPADAEKLVLSASKGSLQLLLRNITDSAPVASRGATLAKVLGEMEQPPAAKVPAAKPVGEVRREPKPAPTVRTAVAPRGFTLDIIRGTEKTSKQYAE